MKNNNLLAILLLLPIIHVSHCYSADPNHIKPVELTQGVSTKIKPTLTTIKKLKIKALLILINYAHHPIKKLFSLVGLNYLTLVYHQTKNYFFLQ